MKLGGAYTDSYLKALQEGLIWSILADKYIWKPDEYFVSWWMIHPEDVETLQDGVRPVARLSGSVCYIVEFGKMPNVSARRMAYDLRRREPTLLGVCWNNFRTKQFKYFSNQVGKE